MEQVTDLLDRLCANPRCLRVLSDRLPSSTKYCGHCQRKLKRLVMVFPDVELQDVTFLLEHDWADLGRVARLLGVERRSVMRYRQKGLLKFVQQGKYALASIKDIVSFALWKRRHLTMRHAARFLKVSYGLLKKLVRQRVISPDFRLGRMKYFDRQNLAGKREAIRDWQSNRHARRVASNQIPVRSNEFSIRQIATILGMSVQGVWYHIEKGSLATYRRAGNTYASKKKFRSFCRGIVSGSIDAISYTKNHAQRYLESIAAGQN